MAHLPLNPQTVLLAYAQGAFPMAQPEIRNSTFDTRTSDSVHWFTADPRAILPLDERFRVRRSLARVVRSGHFTITRDRAFSHVIAACAQPRPGEAGTWINEPIIRVFCQLHEMGYAHSVEAWLERTDLFCRVPRPRVGRVDHRAHAHAGMAPEANQSPLDRGDDHAMQLVGGLYGVALGSAFFGESMFSNAPYASQVALVHLVEHLRARHFDLLDVQFANPHLRQFAVQEIPAGEYLTHLRRAVVQPPCW
ncbi:MAG: leucyl/phenylalanyl-tRNA--protein transferase [Phycisphaeraceae bacterium]|nr:leucyl/phenylalanyl-tRNA--protein transferase [Phycisphaeraceae bacterium]